MASSVKFLLHIYVQPGSTLLFSNFEGKQLKLSNLMTSC